MLTSGRIILNFRGKTARKMTYVCGKQLEYKRLDELLQILIPSVSPMLRSPELKLSLPNLRIINNKIKGVRIEVHTAKAC